MSERIQEAFARLTAMIPTKSPLRNSPSQALYRHSPSDSKASIDEVISLPNSPTRESEMLLAEAEYDMVETPRPHSPTMDVHAVKRLPWEGSTKWLKAADLTTDYESINPSTLTSTITEPCPKMPPEEPRPLTEGEIYAINRSVMNQVATRADFWFQGTKETVLKYGIVQETSEFLRAKQRAQHDIRLIMDHAGEDKNGVTNRAQAREFFKRVASGLLELEARVKREQGEEGVVELGAYEKVLATSFFELDMDMDTSKFIVFELLRKGVVGVMKQQRATQERGKQKATTATGSS